MTTLCLAMLLFPLGGGLFQAFFGRGVARRVAEIMACLAAFGAFAAAVFAFGLQPGGNAAFTLVHLADWFEVGRYHASMSVLFDHTAAAMAVTVTFTAFLIHLHSVAFMREDPAYTRYFCYLNLFIFFMLVITLADDLVFLFLGWEGVGFCSFSLIGFWHQDPDKVDAGRKAFLMTRAGDVGYIAALALILTAAGHASIHDLVTRATPLGPGVTIAVGLLFLWAACGKSAQLPLSAWLPDAMAGPTPVSALIHAATMVTAGVYLLLRLFPLLASSQIVLVATALVGATTAFYAACAALFQRDVKRILAYSTISQVGYMFLGLGAGDAFGPMYHLMTHAFFKSLLFMGAGCLILAVHEDHDIFHMGRRVRAAMPRIVPLLAAGAASLAAVPLTAGFFSKGHIFASALARAVPGGGVYGLCWMLGAAGALLTAFYAFRLVLVALYGEGSSEPEAPAPHAPRELGLLTAPLWPLAVLAIGFGALGPWLASYLPGAEGHVPAALHWLNEGMDVFLAVAGLILAWVLYAPGSRRRVVESARAYPVFLAGGFGLERLYERVVAKPYRVFASVLWRGGDQLALDGSLGLFARSLLLASRGLGRWSTGRVSTTLFMLLVAVAGLAVWLAAALG